METNYLGLFVIFALLISDAIALYWVSRRDLSSTARAVWVLVMLAIPALAVIAFTIANQGRKRSYS
jgi:hypothetical protein